MPTVNYHIKSGLNNKSVIEDYGQITQWFIDGLVKIHVPVPTKPNFELFGKFGLVYRAGVISDNEINSSVYVPIVNTPYSNNLQPILGGGLQYHLTSNWMINAQYLFLPYSIVSSAPIGPVLNDHSILPSTQLVTGGIAYYFE